MKRVLALWLVVLLASVCLSSCAPSGIQSGSTISIAQLDEFNSLNADNITTEASLSVNREVSNLINPSFFFIDANGELVANEKFGTVEILSQKPFKVRYSLTGQASWSDGQQVTARDLLLSWLAARNPADAGFNTVRTGSGLRFSQGVPAVSPDGLAIEVTFDRAIADWRTAITITAAAHLVASSAFDTETVRDAFARFDDAIRVAKVSDQTLLSEQYAEIYLVRNGLSEAAKVSAGPYLVSSYAYGSTLTLKANPAFSWGPMPKIETLNLRFYNDSTTMLAAMQAGEVDIAAPIESGIATNSDLIGLAKAANAKYEFAASNSIEAILLNFGEGSLFSDISQPEATNLRDAFLQIVARAKILSALSADNAVIEARSWIYSSSSNYYTPFIESNGSSEFLIQNAERAQEALSGLELSKPIDVRVLFDKDNPRAKLEFALLGEYAAGVGFNLVDVSAADPRIIFAAGGFDVFITTVGLAGEISGDPYWFTGVSVGHFENAKIDDLLVKFSNLEDQLEQIAVLKEIDAELFAARFGLPLYQVPSLLVYSKRITSIVKAPFGQSATYGYWNWAVAR